MIKLIKPSQLGWKCDCQSVISSQLLYSPRLLDAAFAACSRYAGKAVLSQFGHIWASSGWVNSIQIHLVAVQPCGETSRENAQDSQIKTSQDSGCYHHQAASTLEWLECQRAHSHSSDQLRWHRSWRRPEAFAQKHRLCRRSHRHLSAEGTDLLNLYPKPGSSLNALRVAAARGWWTPQ